ncbi:MAG: anti-sigma factor family protein [Pseudomonadota bacterium]
MRCDHDRARIALLLDGELPAPERAAVTSHAADCPDCRRYRDELLALRRQLRRARAAPPAALADRLRLRLDYEAADMAAAPVRAPAPARRALQLLDRARPHLRTYGLRAAALLAACILSIAATLWWVGETGGPRPDQAHDVLAAHVRSLLQDSSVQVASLDTHTVKPWFAGRLDYTPVVKDLAADGFKLEGGRLDYIDGRRVAALVYLRRLHRISLFIWPAEGPEIGPERAKIDGYNLISWRRAGMRYWAISDLDETELGQLPNLL